MEGLIVVKKQEKDIEMNQSLERINASIEKIKGHVSNRYKSGRLVLLKTAADGLESIEKFIAAPSKEKPSAKK
jgi:hypothetical protein